MSLGRNENAFGSMSGELSAISTNWKVHDSWQHTLEQSSTRKSDRPLGISGVCSEDDQEVRRPKRLNKSRDYTMCNYDDKIKAFPPDYRTQNVDRSLCLKCARTNTIFIILFLRIYKHMTDNDVRMRQTHVNLGI